MRILADAPHPQKGAAVDLKELKALELAARAQIVFDGSYWIVPSQSSPTTYRVTIDEQPSCECEDFSLTGKLCKHIIAVRLVRERDGLASAPPMDTSEVPKRPTYKQNWPAYNLAQTTEKNRFQVLLADLCSGMVDPPHDGPGRKPIPLADRLFAACFKVWSGMSARRFNCDLQEATERGYLSRTLHCQRASQFLEEEELTPYLRALIVRSSLPLRAVETEFAVDSSGFSTSRFVRWYDHKYGVVRQEHDWVKVHIAIGRKTHVVTAVAIYDRDAADSPIMPELVKATAENFTVKEFSADKAYLSVENVETVFAVGGLPFIAPKVNTTGGVGGLFEKMVHFYQYKRDEFLRHYHLRSNVESVFSAVKRKFGDAVRSKTETAMTNEVLAKFVCNNLWCVILSQIELGIEAEFWRDETNANEPKQVLRFPG